MERAQRLHLADRVRELGLMDFGVTGSHVFAELRRQRRLADGPQLVLNTAVPGCSQRCCNERTHERV